MDGLDACAPAAPLLGEGGFLLVLAAETLALLTRFWVFGVGLVAAMA